MPKSNGSEQIEDTRIILVPAGLTVWQEEGRLVGNANLPLSETGRAQAIRWAEQLSEEHLDVIYCYTSGPIKETAGIIAKNLKLKVRDNANLAEINLGLWQGMPMEEIKQRHPKVYKQWRENPESVTPPDGESIASLRKRIEPEVQTITNKNRGKRVAIVLGQVSLAVIRIRKEGHSISALWNLVDEPLTWHEYIIKGENQTES